MMLYTYTAWDDEGARYEGFVQAQDSADAKRKLRRKGLYVTKLIEPGDGAATFLRRFLLGWRKRERST